MTPAVTAEAGGARYSRTLVMHDRMRRAALRALLACALVVPGLARASDVPNVAAASDLQFALPEIVAAFRRETGHDVRLSFGSSGNFRRQIADGAPFELFLSADAAYTEALFREGRTVDAGVVYAIGRLALVVPKDSPIALDGELRGLAAALAAGHITRFAIANPEHAPYGRAAREALTRAGLWKAIEPRLVLGENVSQAAQFATSGATQGGIVAYSLARAPGMDARARSLLLPRTLHAPLVQRMVLLRNAGATARLFYAYLQQAPAQSILARYGFDVPPAAGGSNAARRPPT
ncbi:MAG: molybdate ABC transporter substrate-binding protein [Rudaea sp.]